MPKCCKCKCECPGNAKGELPGGHCKDCAKKHNAVKKRKNQLSNHLYLEEEKKRLGCMVCGEMDPLCLIYRDNSVSKMFSKSPRLFRKKLSQTIIMCFNCRAKEKAGVVKICILPPPPK